MYFIIILQFKLLTGLNGYALNKCASIRNVVLCVLQFLTPNNLILTVILFIETKQNHNMVFSLYIPRFINLKEPFNLALQSRSNLILNVLSSCIAQRAYTINRALKLHTPNFIVKIKYILYIEFTNNLLYTAFTVAAVFIALLPFCRPF